MIMRGYSNVARISLYLRLQPQHMADVVAFFKGMEHVPNILMSFDNYLFLEVINILNWIGLFKQSELQLFKKYLKPI